MNFPEQPEIYDRCNDCGTYFLGIICTHCNPIKTQNIDWAIELVNERMRDEQRQTIENGRDGKGNE